MCIIFLQKVISGVLFGLCFGPSSYFQLFWKILAPFPNVTGIVNFANILQITDVLKLYFIFTLKLQFLLFLQIHKSFKDRKMLFPRVVTQMVSSKKCWYFCGWLRYKRRIFLSSYEQEMWDLCLMWQKANLVLQAKRGKSKQKLKI